MINWDTVFWGIDTAILNLDLIVTRPRAIEAAHHTCFNVMAIVTLLLSNPTGTAAQTDGPWKISFRSITDDIHVAYRPEPLRYLVEGNVTIVVNEHDVVVVDGS